MKNPLGFQIEDLQAFEREALQIMRDEAADARLDTSLVLAPINPKQITVTEVI